MEDSTIKVNFYENPPDDLLDFAVIAATYQGKWVFCKHRERETYEIPGGRREPGETILQTAKRELAEETGAIAFTITPVCAYSVTGKTRVNETGKESFGMLYYAEIENLDSQLYSEIERIDFFDALPEQLTYPLIQPFLFAKVQEGLSGR